MMKLSFKGFTIVELTLVAGVLGLLIAGVIIVINPVSQIDKAQDGKRKTDLVQIQRALDLYYHDFGRYPPSTSGYLINNIQWGSAWTPYSSKLPSDPSPTKRYVYISSPTGQAYWLYTNLSRGRNDPQACTNGADCPNVPAANLCGNSPCNFGITSPNVSP